MSTCLILMGCYRLPASIFYNQKSYRSVCVFFMRAQSYLMLGMYHIRNNVQDHLPQDEL